MLIWSPLGGASGGLTPIGSPPSIETGIAPAVTLNVSLPCKPLTANAVGAPALKSTMPPLAPVFTLLQAKSTAMVSADAEALTTNESDPPEEKSTFTV